ncbi:hypothetical protein L7F22_066562 [Adiantum nelumboides]|nr:hypothetical protein [Adiantum nelumboides]
MVRQLLNVSYSGAFYNPQNWNDFIFSSSTQNLVELTELIRQVLGSFAILAQKVQTLGENTTKAAAYVFPVGVIEGDYNVFKRGGLGISLHLHEHPVVMTVEEQSKHLGHLEITLSKNLFLKDKKGRLYLVSALAPTTVDLKALSQRLGLGKGGLRMAPEDALQDVLKVPFGSVTPLALFNPSARSVILLLDHQYQNQEKLLFHPLDNDSTLGF